MAYITKDGKWLAYRDATQEILEYDDFSDVQQVYQPEWFWVDNKDDAKEFIKELEDFSFGYAKIIGEVIEKGKKPIIVD